MDWQFRLVFVGRVISVWMVIMSSLSKDLLTVAQTFFLRSQLIPSRTIVREQVSSPNFWLVWFNCGV